MRDGGECCFVGLQTVKKSTRLDEGHDLTRALAILPYCVPFVPFLGTSGVTAVTDRTDITGLPVAGAFWHLPFETF